MTDTPKPSLKLERIKAITDGVLAIVLTILVLGFEVPEHEFSEDGVLGFLHKLRIPFLAYVVSFGVVAAYWIQHTVILHYVRVGDRILVWLNLLFLLPLTLLPFFTDLRVEYHEEYRVTVLYAAANVVSGLLLLAMWSYARRRDLGGPVAPEVDRSMRHRILLGVGLNAAGAAVAPISVHLSSVAFLALPLIYVSHTVVDRHWGDARAEA